jgi:hypothetical protein
MAMSEHSSVGQFQNIVANAFRKAGWRVAFIRQRKTSALT